MARSVFSARIFLFLPSRPLQGKKCEIESRWFLPRSVVQLILIKFSISTSQCIEFGNWIWFVLIHLRSAYCLSWSHGELLESVFIIFAINKDEEEKHFHWTVWVWYVEYVSDHTTSSTAQQVTVLVLVSLSKCTRWSISTSPTFLASCYLLAENQCSDDVCRRVKQNTDRDFNDKYKRRLYKHVCTAKLHSDTSSWARYFGVFLFRSPSFCCPSLHRMHRGVKLFRVNPFFSRFLSLLPQISGA